ncbi:hypothetical protein [Fulvivirga lutimaris]|uniref:hypothetical protein n=1 Tax=Fulvivirga lutimaris TaxID=1819566 RepID=UPI0012BB7FBB|nr:hypothetical protein [Fulvivirga lutimaris]MTI39553.1 hypothetical protein [Fulvivirga lutimaris]
MFDTFNFSMALDEDQFDAWLEKGRNSKLGYQYILIIWDTIEEDYKPIYLEDREKITEYHDILAAQEVPVAAYDLYSESKITLDQ